MVLLVASAPTAAAPKPITGKLSKPGYTVIALSASGKATAVQAKRRRFRLRSPARRLTLHLRGRDGRYAGPIVVRREKRGRRAVLGVNAGARLGKVRVRKGYAKVSKRLRTKWLDSRRAARARRGVPIGARRFGRVRSRGARGPSSDRDLDGIPSVFDIDDDGDLILDNLDRSRASRAAQAGDESFTTHFDLGVALPHTANANAPGSTDSQIEAALPSFGRIDLHILPGESAELDCGEDQSRTDPGLGGLVYCTTGGTGVVPISQPAPGLPQGELVPFPDCCDPDGDGFGTLANNAGDLEPNQGLFPRATSAQIGTGDVLIQRVMRGGVETQFLTTLQYVFATVPALVSYDDGQGNSTTVAYPVPESNPGPPGTPENGFPVRAGPNGEVVVSLTFWRPQRRPLPPETGDWIDIGGLNYTAGVAGMDLRCPQSAFSESDPKLTAAAPETLEGGGFRDLAPDQPASAANTLTYTLNLTECLRSPVSDGRPMPGFSFDPGEVRGFKFSGLSPNGANGGETEQSIAFRRE